MSGNMYTYSLNDTMSDELKERLKSIKKKMDLDYERVVATDINKVSDRKQNKMFKSFIDEMSMEISKGTPDDGYFLDVVKSFKGCELTAIRYAVEKSFDRYSRTIQLMHKYDENFDEQEFVKYESRYNVLNKILSFMVSNNIGEYTTDERTTPDGQ